LEPEVNSSQPQDLISVDQAADEFTVSRSTLYRVLNQGNLPRFRRRGDRRTFVSRSQVASLLGFRPITDA
jgi:excisionase family DNA binding protein